MYAFRYMNLEINKNRKQFFNYYLIYIKKKYKFLLKTKNLVLTPAKLK